MVVVKRSSKRQGNADEPMHVKLRRLLLVGGMSAVLVACGSGTPSTNINVPDETPGVSLPKAAAVPTLSYEPIKGLVLTWQDVADATTYRVLENPDGMSGFTYLEDVPSGSESVKLTVPLYKRVNAQYILQTCNDAGCIDSTPVNVELVRLVDSVGYFKASNAERNDFFGSSVAISSDGKTMAIGASGEDSGVTGVNGDQDDNLKPDAGAVYVFELNGSEWLQTAYIKASSNDLFDYFGASVSLSDDGNTLAVGAEYEDSDSTGINGSEDNNNANNSGAVYVFTRDASGVTRDWSQQAYIKASNAQPNDYFGYKVSLSGDGLRLAVSARGEDSAAQTVNGDQTDNSSNSAGAVYLFRSDGNDWTQEAYIKGSFLGTADRFGGAVSLNRDGSLLVVSATGDDSAARGIGKDGSDALAPNSGAVYVFGRTGVSWTEQAYIKASNAESRDLFGTSVSLSGDGQTLAVGAYYESRGGVGANADPQSVVSLPLSGAVYVFVKNGNIWAEQAYLKASNADQDDEFGYRVALSDDGNVLAASALSEQSIGIGLNGNQASNDEWGAGAVYLFTREASNWRQANYIKPPTIPGRYEEFGSALALSGDGQTLAIGTLSEDSNATGLNGDPSNDDSANSGAVYLY